MLQSHYSKLNMGCDFDESSLLHATDNTPVTPSKTPMTRPSMKKPSITRNLTSAFDGLSSPDPVRVRYVCLCLFVLCVCVATGLPPLLLGVSH